MTPTDRAGFTFYILPAASLYRPVPFYRPKLQGCHFKTDTVLLGGWHPRRLAPMVAEYLQASASMTAKM